ncbi:fungal hydrophobin-domain-containing protein [Fomes fomentarius]|nr:fungal hydrophobin-domain-containing protein [Fomes fomentarius]
MRASIAASLLPFTVLAAAHPRVTTTTTTTTAGTVAARGGEPGSHPGGGCSTGPVQCCNTVDNAESPSTATLLSLLGIVVQGVDVLVGMNCSPVNVIGAADGSCSTNAVCCQNNNVGGLVSIGCVPVDL